MDIQIFVCDSALAVEHILEDLGNDADILYRSPGATGESGDIIRCNVRPPRGDSETLGSFAAKFIVVARRDD